MVKENCDGDHIMNYTFAALQSKQISLPVSGFVSKCVRDFDICLHSASSLEQSVGVRDDLRGKRVPFTWDNSRSGINGSTQNSARSPTGLHHGITTCKYISNFHNVRE
jgi:hypothetical protein